MDFVIGLPKSKSGKDTIWVVVDRLTKSAHFLLMRAIASMNELVKMFMEEIVRLHGIPVRIVSDRDLRFVSRFWKSFNEVMGTTVSLSTVFHLQTDG
jgi:hypothetical protein